MISTKPISQRELVTQMVFMKLNELLEKFSLNFSSCSFVIRVNLLHP